MLEKKTRNLPVEGTFNSRDFGGYETTDGKKVVWGKIFRSDALCLLTDDDVTYFEEMGLKTIVDFRGKKEIEVAPDREIPGATWINLNPHADVAELATGNIVNDKEKIEKLVQLVKQPGGEEVLLSRLDEMAEQMRRLVNTEVSHHAYRKYLQLLTDKENLPIIHHCKGGKDRAGFAAILVLLALGVSIETIKEDYMLTKSNMVARNEKRMNEYREYTDHPVVLQYLSGLMSTKEIYFDATVDEIERLSTSPIDYLLNVIGITEDELAAIRANLLTD